MLNPSNVSRGGDLWFGAPARNCASVMVVTVCSNPARAAAAFLNAEDGGSHQHGLSGSLHTEAEPCRSACGRPCGDPCSHKHGVGPHQRPGLGDGSVHSRHLARFATNPCLKSSKPLYCRKAPCEYRPLPHSALPRKRVSFFDPSRPSRVVKHMDANDGVADIAGRRAVRGK
jgi:hypothetical protein